MLGHALLVTSMMAILVTAPGTQSQAAGGGAQFDVVSIKPHKSEMGTGGGNRGAAPGTTPVARRAAIGHISFGITPFDPDLVKAELDKRGLSARVDTGGRGDIHTSPYKSYHTTTPNGYDLQISATTRANREG